MATKTNLQPNMDDLRDLLSPYLDGEVTAEEQSMVEEALRVSPELAAELEELKLTVNLLAELPVVAAPRPLTLTAADVASVAHTLPSKKQRWFAVPAWAGGLIALAATLICVVAVGGLLWTSSMGGSMSVPSQEIALQQDSAAVPEAEADTAVSGAAAPPLAAEEKSVEIEEAPQAEMVEQPSAPVEEENAVVETNQAEMAGAAADVDTTDDATTGEGAESALLPADPEQATAAEEVFSAGESAQEEIQPDTDEAARAAAAVEEKAEEEPAMMAEAPPDAPSEIAESEAAPQPAASPSPSATATVSAPPPTSTPIVAATAIPEATLIAQEAPTAGEIDPRVTVGPPSSPPQRTVGSRGLTLLAGFVVVLAVIGLVGWSIRRKIK
jgi:anti-sigma factor RsiW